MALARYQPRSKVRLRPDYQGRTIAAVFNNSRTEVGSGLDINFFNNPELTVVAGYGMARRFVTANSSYATISPPSGIVDFTKNIPFAIVCVLTPQTIGVATRILSYRHEYDVNGIQLGYTTSNRLGYWYGSSSGSPAVRGAGVATTIKVGQPNVVVFGWDGSDHFMYIDGVVQGAQSIATFVTSNAGTNTDINIGRRNTGSSYFDGSISLFAHIKGPVNAASLSTNPWQIFEEEDGFSNIKAQIALQLRRALYLGGQGYIMQSTGGMSVKPLVLLNGSIKQRSTNEGLPLVYEGGKLRTLAPDETLDI